MNELFEKRHAVRSFSNKEISEQDLKEIMKAIDSAPSAGNLKAREVLVVKDLNKKKQLAKAAWGQEFIIDASVLLVFFAIPERSAKKYGDRGRTLYSLQDATIAASFAWLQAVDLGLSACWIGAFEEEEVKDILNIKENWMPVAILPVGYEK